MKVYCQQAQHELCSKVECPRALGNLSQVQQHADVQPQPETCKEKVWKGKQKLGRCLAQVCQEMLGTGWGQL